MKTPIGIDCAYVAKVRATRKLIRCLICSFMPREVIKP